ncbi:MAG: hypothetical protein K2Q03_09045 [Sphingobacteriaceae bacterium]|nr:hypothetical protein [Sphingobacteriaceae bacterium]
MKNFIQKWLFAFGFVALLLNSTPSKAQEDIYSVEVFYQELSPYGTWIVDREYGRVWRPRVNHRSFRPYYSDGRWVMTQYGNTWVSNYNWGWAPFHYGRWFFNRYREWVWIPGTQWGPAWVSWRSGGGYYGWAPMGPNSHVSRDIDGMPIDYWNFVPQSNIYGNSYPSYYRSRNRDCYRNTVIINNVYVNNNHSYYIGPRADEVRRVTRQNVQTYNVARSDNFNAPRIEQTTINFYTPRPSRGENNTQVGGNGSSGQPSRSNSYQNTSTATQAPIRSEQNNRVEPIATPQSQRPARTEAPAKVETPIAQPQMNRPPSRSEQSEGSPTMQPQRPERTANPQGGSRSQQSAPVANPAPQAGGRPSRGG